MEKTAPGKGILKVIGILGIIFGGINSIVVLIGLMTAEFWDTVMPATGGFPWQVYYLFAFVVVGYGIYASIMAIMHCATLEKASFLKTLGIISVVLVVIMGIVDISAIGMSAAVMLPINLVLPILYIHGASKNVKAYGG